MLKKVFLANPRGFCAGVKYAISFVDEVQKMSKETIYVRKEIVHNKRVVEDMKNRGIVFVEDVNEVPDYSTLIFSAHGVSPQVVKEAQRKQLKIGDATCPLVTRVHNKAKRFKENFQIIYIGHKGHDEAIGTMGEAPMYLVESIEDVENLKYLIDPKKPLTYLMQTTLSVHDTKSIVEKISEIFPFVEHPAKGDICYATTERQEAVQSMLSDIDAMMVIGADNSSNSLRLLQLAQKEKKHSFKVTSALDLKKEYFYENSIQILGITAGASSPQILLDEIIVQLKVFFPNLEVELFPGSREDGMNFRLPKELLKKI